MRIAVLNRDKCKKAECGYICQKVCPGVRTGDETIVIDEDSGYPIINEELCTGCGICVKRCPQRAISIVNIPEMRENPIHQYGDNGFRVFGLPTPKEGIVGIIGPNGIGKSTVMRILSGKIVPNLGSDNSDWDQVINRFKGQEILNYLKALKEGSITVSFKPQEVDKLPRVFDGTVKELLEATPGTDLERAKELSKELGVEWNKQIKELSGGELQKVAILVTLSKNADLYFLDEPSSFLDIKERMKLARLISKLANENKFMIVEHDLVVLDYLSDWVHVMFGKPGVYGIVSTLKSAKKGINEFLDGFLKAENMRIRNERIKFEIKPPSSEWKGKVLLEYPEIEKTYPGFKLKADSGKIKEGEVIGIVGPNGIGKSTFISILAGQTESDSGKLEIELTVSYKPQYITLDFDGTVREYIHSQEIDNDVFSAYVAPKVSDLYEKRVEELSGGELQRLLVGVTISKKSDIILLDEPSAFLDIEQRLEFSDLIRRIAEKTKRPAIVIDHDITFLDYISNRLIVFSGEPGVHGHASAPMSMRDGMNRFLKDMEITFRRDTENGRPRINKLNSQKDREQKERGEYYYTTG